MTQLTVGEGSGVEVPFRCRWCRRPVASRPGRGRPREFCRRSCRQRHYEARRRAAEVGLSEQEVILARAELDAFGDRLYMLEAAIDDVDGDRPQATTIDDYRAMLDWLLEAGRAVVAVPPGRARRS